MGGIMMPIYHLLRYSLLYAVLFVKAEKIDLFGKLYLRKYVNIFD